MLICQYPLPDNLITNFCNGSCYVRDAHLTDLSWHSLNHYGNPPPPERRMYITNKNLHPVKLPVDIISVIHLSSEGVELALNFVEDVTE